MSIEKQLVELKSKGEQLNTLRIQNSTKLKGLEDEKNKLLAEAAELGIAPDKIEEVLKQEETALQAEIDGLTARLDKILNDIRQVQ